LTAMASHMGDDLTVGGRAATGGRPQHRNEKALRPGLYSIKGFRAGEGN